MSSAKKAAAAKKGDRETKKPGPAGKQSPVGASRVPAKTESRLPVARASKTPAKSESKPPAKREAAPPAKKEKQVPAPLPPRTTATQRMEELFSAIDLPPQAAAVPAKSGPDANPYLPEITTVAERIQETAQIVTLRLVLDDPAKMKSFSFKPGQVGQLSVFGAGESTFVINSPPSQKEYLQMSVMKAGEVTGAIHKLAAGDKVGLRAPLGNFFPYEQWVGKDVFFVGGGIGMAPIRTIMLHLVDNRKNYGKISLLYGARSPQDMAYSYELDGWLQSLDTTLTIDAPFEGWKHRVGLIPNVLLELAPKPKNCVAVLCGPPIMIKFTLQALQKLGFPDDQVYTTLERRMKCGIGICGRCNIGHKYVCVNGPVFSLAELKGLPDEL
jgi:NAD(P)H-flavin reductase